MIGGRDVRHALAWLELSRVDAFRGDGSAQFSLLFPTLSDGESVECSRGSLERVDVGGVTLRVRHGGSGRGCCCCMGIRERM